MNDNWNNPKKIRKIFKDNPGNNIRIGFVGGYYGNPDDFFGEAHGIWFSV